MHDIFSVLEDLWQQNKLPQSSIIESPDIDSIDSAIMAFITSVTSKYTNVSSESNTDVHRIFLGSNKKGETVKIINVEQIREMQQYLSSTSAVAPFRFSLILEADNMNLNASNCLLKILEDTPKNSFILLITKHAANLIPTIRSRCILIFQDRIHVKNHSDIFDSNIYALLNPEVRFEKKQELLDELLNSKKNSQEELNESIISAIAKLLNFKEESKNNEFNDIRKYTEKTNISIKELCKYCEDTSFLLNSAKQNFLDIRQILLLLIAKFSLL